MDGAHHTRCLQRLVDNVQVELHAAPRPPTKIFKDIADDANRQWLYVGSSHGKKPGLRRSAGDATKRFVTLVSDRALQSYIQRSAQTGFTDLELIPIATEFAEWLELFLIDKGQDQRGSDLRNVHDPAVSDKCAEGSPASVGGLCLSHRRRLAVPPRAPPRVRPSVAAYRNLTTVPTAAAATWPPPLSSLPCAHRLPSELLDASAAAAAVCVV